MSESIHCPLFTQVFDPPRAFVPESNTVLVHGEWTEERHSWVNSLKCAKISITQADIERYLAKFAGEVVECSLRSSASAKRFWSLATNVGRDVILDLTSLPHSVWAHLITSGESVVERFRVSYAEPESYQQHVAPPLEGDIFDLSEKIGGISPLPGFASFRDDLEDNFLLVAILGFEGTRFAHIVESVQPHGSRIIPIIGAPGFRPEFVFHAFIGNRRALLANSCWTRVRYASANCPFSLAYLLEEIAAEYPQSLLKIATLGTKPHALGAFLFARKWRRQVEFIYDHPVRKKNRTGGVARLLLYNVSTFLR